MQNTFIKTIFMKRFRHALVRSLLLLVATLSLCACGGSPWRYDPGLPQTPSGLVATAGNGQVSLSWTPGQSSSSFTYNVYYATSPGVSAASGTRIANIPGTSSSVIVPGLRNDVRYYFAVSAGNSRGETALSGEVSATPSLPGPFQQSDLQGSWRFNALVTGAGAKWLRGSVAIDAAGAVSVSSYLDSAGTTSAPAGLFGALTILPDGSVLQDGAADFHGVLSSNLQKDMMVATVSLSSASRMLIILQKVVPGVSFSAADIKGTGRAVAGPLTMVYHQLSSGAVSEWEYATLQVGQDQAETYQTLDAQSSHPLPGNGSKVVSLSITADGIVSESANAGVLPQPAALITNGVMSADKMTIVGTATDANGSYLLRVIQLIHPPATLLTSSSYALADLAGNYGYLALGGGGNPYWGTGTLIADAAGGTAFDSYLDSNGASAVPAPYTLAMDQQGMLSSSADPSYHGHFAYLKDMFVATGTDAAGAPIMSIALKR